MVEWHFFKDSRVCVVSKKVRFLGYYLLCDPSASEEECMVKFCLGRKVFG